LTSVTSIADYVRLKKSDFIRLLFPSLFMTVMLCFAGPAAGATVKNGLALNTCLQTSATPYAGVHLQLNACDGTPSQEFTFWDNGEIRVGSLCVEVAASPGRRQNGDAVVLGYCLGLPSAKWDRTSTGEIADVDGQCMDVSGAAAGSKVMVWTCRDVPAQKWAVTDVISATALSREPT
jgi:hypothetical protein